MIVDHDLHNHDGELLDNRRREAWQNIVDKNRSRRLHIDPDIDISRLADEVNDMDLELEARSTEVGPKEWAGKQIVEQKGSCLYQADL